MADDGGVLGNLPNSRPGRRSSKRPAQPRAAANPRPRAGSDPSPAASNAEPQADAVSDVIRAATGIASAGARVANGVAREVVRRLPRI